MKKIFWFATGIAAGLAVAKQLRENPEAKAALDDAAKRARALGDAFTSGYKEREAELKKPVAKKPAAATIKQIKCTIFAPCFCAKRAKNNADRKVTTLYHPFTSPVHDTASSYWAGFSDGLMVNLKGISELNFSSIILPC